MKAPKVSVVVPVYNGSRHLEECLDSIASQDFADLEILVSDDGSTDDSHAIIEKYASQDRRFRWWINSTNAGLAGNANICLRAAAGEYIKFVHQDDSLLSSAAVSQLAAALDQNPQASLASCRQTVVGTHRQPLHFFKRSGVYDGRQVIVASLESNTNLIGQPILAMFRRAQAQRGFDERFIGFSDFEMWCHLLEQGSLAYLAEDLAAWRTHAHNETARIAARGDRNFEHLRFMEIYFAKSWLREAATDRMLFTQIYYLEKKYGQEASQVAGAMKAQLGTGPYLWQWLLHKAGGPAKKLGRKLARTKNC